MSAEVIKFPTVALEKNTVRHFHELFAKMDALGLSQRDQTELIFQTIKEMGMVQVGGVWRMPEETR